MRRVDAACFALDDTSPKKPQNEEGETKFNRDPPCRKNYGKSVALSPEDVATIKTRIGWGYGAEVVGAA